MIAGRMLRRAVNEVVAGVGGGGLTLDAARWAAVGEAVERWIVHPLPSDGLVEGSYRSRAHAEPAVFPSALVGFHLDPFSKPAI
ncbi:MAG: ribosomal protein S12 methylthiotransferase accessory factor YcaO [Myxococcota bacterium]|jgi:ribosomal protein S12 methylthiotransferase accessory factor YcaO